jgi:GNAT superfamily N-acetyltransferase
VNGLPNNYEITGDVGRVDFDMIHKWLTNSYWSPGVPMETVRRAAENSSLVISVFERSTGNQVGYGRIISDKTTFGYLADIYVDEQHRAKGIGKAIVRFALDHPEHQGFRRWFLATMDAHKLYEQCGFRAPYYPERWMEYRPVPPAS